MGSSCSLHSSSSSGGGDWDRVSSSSPPAGGAGGEGGTGAAAGPVDRWDGSGSGSHYCPGGIDENLAALITAGAGVASLLFLFREGLDFFFEISGTFCTFLWGAKGYLSARSAKKKTILFSRLFMAS